MLFGSLRAARSAPWLTRSTFGAWMQSARPQRAADALAPPDHWTRYKGVTRTMSAFTPTVTGTGPRAAIQRFGAFLAGMIMPNLGAFIAWGLITALTIPNGWI